MPKIPHGESRPKSPNRKFNHAASWERTGLVGVIAFVGFPPDFPFGDAIWTRIGSAWQHADGKGINILIETMPLDGRISLRIPAEKSE